MKPKTQPTVVVTGGSRGIGRAICLALAATRPRLFFNYRSDTTAAAETLAACRAAGADVSAVAVDVADGAAVAAFFDQVLTETGRIDVLVCNAGITRDNLVMRMSPADWDAVIATDLTGAFHCVRAAARPMARQRSGRIILVSSVVGAAGNAGQANYAAAKAGLIGLAKSLARELASRGVTVNAVAPGLVDTDMAAALEPAAREALISTIPLGRIGTAEEVAAAVGFLASEAAGYITGQVLHVNGGMYM
ncbi:MAG TPA: 3-oxoacyl-[acyl-carrier-protein] reductase [Desulfobacteraceae bacterium]|nr:3-oxoacyl-[acyl-carrier-protein] reductase [Deltaproteobacteria bacterium]RLB99034.1 MAG: 3-oxoacyl-[acyl-carrier-protein] reductase [Deltaproteobacteria bacterium]HDI60740.1 3-oxoacyl-[acyl-carrier-protein] reductase [Desulfobacteraceae bacterium]